jgi:ABC transporter family protein
MVQAATAPRFPKPVRWSDFLASWEWKQGEHVTLLGPTGAGKTTLANSILSKRAYVVVLATKPRDATLSKLRSQGFEVTREWPPPATSQRVILWPRIERVSDVVNQRVQFAKALMDIYRRGGWAVDIDETRYLTDTLKLAPILELLWLQGRAMDVTMIASTQRPRSIPIAALSEASHFFMWKSRDLYDVKRLREIGGYVDPQSVVETLGALNRHQCLYIDARYGNLAVTQVR